MWFGRFKENLYATPVYIFSELTKLFVVDTDASDQMVGAVVIQIHFDKLSPVAYYYKKYWLSDRHYSAYKKQLLEIFKAG